MLFSAVLVASLFFVTMQEKTITFVTGNANKLSEFISILGPDINFKVSIYRSHCVLITSYSFNMCFLSFDELVREQRC